MFPDEIYCTQGTKGVPLMVPTQQHGQVSVVLLGTPHNDLNVILMISPLYVNRSVE